MHLGDGTENWFLLPVNQCHGPENCFRGSSHPGNGTKNLGDVRRNPLRATENQQPKEEIPE